MSEATETRNILVDFPDFPTGAVTFKLRTYFAAQGTEGFPKKDYTLTLDANGVGTQALPVPTTDSWLWAVRLPDGNSYAATLAAGDDLQLTTWLASALSTETAASLVDQFAGLANFDAHVADSTSVHGIADTALLETTAGAQAKADAAQAAAEAASDPVGSAAAAQAYAIQRTNHTGTQTLSTISDAGTAAAADVGDFDAAGSAAAVAADLTTHEGLTGTAVHGLGSAAVEDASAFDPAGSAAAVQTNLDAHTGAIGLPPRIVNFNTMVWGATDVVGSGSANTAQNTKFDLTTGATASSQVRYRVNDNGLALNLLSIGVNWGRKIEFTSYIRLVNTNAEGVFRAIFGKQTTAAFGAVTGEYYVGYEMQNSTVAKGFLCNGSTVIEVALNVPISSYTTVSILSDNGAIAWYIDGVLAGQTTGGPTTNRSGSVNLEINNGATAAVYRLIAAVQSVGY